MQRSVRVLPLRCNVALSMKKTRVT